MQVKQYTNTATVFFANLMSHTNLLYFYDTDEIPPLMLVGIAKELPLQITNHFKRSKKLYKNEFGEDG